MSRKHFHGPIEVRLYIENFTTKNLKFSSKILIFFIFLLAEAVVPTIYVFSRNMKNIRVFLSENFQFLEMNFLICLNRRVFVMDVRVIGV